MISYVYKISFDEVPHFYLGVRKGEPEGDSYLGSPVTHKCYWEIYTPKKQILWVYDSWEEACAVETVLIKENWNNKYCLNTNANGAFSLESCSKGGRKAAKALHERRLNDPEFDAKIRAAGAKGAKNRDERRRNDPEFDARFRTNCVEAGRNGGLKGGKTGGKAVHDRRRNDREFDAKFRKTSLKGAKSFHERRRNDPEFDSKYKENCARGAKTMNSQRWQCTITGYTSTPGALARYQKARGIDTKNRIRLTL
jgi:hypothetical protein